MPETAEAREPRRRRILRGIGAGLFALLVAAGLSYVDFWALASTADHNYRPAAGAVAAFLVFEAALALVAYRAAQRRKSHALFGVAIGAALALLVNGICGVALLKN